LSVAFDDAADFRLAWHAAIFSSFARPINMGSSDAYDELNPPRSTRNYARDTVSMPPRAEEAHGDSM
jgi:hypothetical protein